MDIGLISASQRGYPVLYLDKVRLYVKDGNVVYSQVEESSIKSFNVPIANISLIMLGVGTSITNEAAIKFSESKTILMFVSSVFYLKSASGQYGDLDINIIEPVSNYSVNGYMQKMIQKTIIDDKLIIAKELLVKRFQFNIYIIEKLLKAGAISYTDIADIKKLNEDTEAKIMLAKSIEELLGYEGNYMNKLYSMFANYYCVKNFIKNEKGVIADRIRSVNSFCYSLASIVLTAFGISYSLNIFHGRTRNGALVYDIADIIKIISIILAFQHSIIEDPERYIKDDNEFRKEIINFIETNNILPELFKITKDVVNA